MALRRLENAMTEAMVRECPKCKNRFVNTSILMIYAIFFFDPKAILWNKSALTVYMYIVYASRISFKFWLKKEHFRFRKRSFYFSMFRITFFIQIQPRLTLPIDTSFVERLLEVCKCKTRCTVSFMYYVYTWNRAAID